MQGRCTCVILSDDLYPHSPSKNHHAVSQMADVYLVDADLVPVYTQYFDITLIPATLFFFNGQHMKVDWR